VSRQDWQTVAGGISKRQSGRRITQPAKAETLRRRPFVPQPPLRLEMREAFQ
jgi:hypothetical protein